MLLRPTPTYVPICRRPEEKILWTPTHGLPGLPIKGQLLRPGTRTLLEDLVAPLVPGPKDQLPAGLAAGVKRGVGPRWGDHEGIRRWREKREGEGKREGEDGHV